MIRRPPRSTRLTHSFPTRRSSDLLAKQIESLRSEHRTLGVAYRKGLDAYIAADSDPLAGDAAVAGIDRATSAQLSELVKPLGDAAAQRSETIRADAQRTASFGPTIMILPSVVVALFSLRSGERRVGKG